MTKPEAIRKARRLARRLDTEVYVIQDEPPFGCQIISQSYLVNYPDGWIEDCDILAVYDKMGRCA